MRSHSRPEHEVAAAVDLGVVGRVGRYRRNAEIVLQLFQILLALGVDALEYGLTVPHSVPSSAKFNSPELYR
jgi:hypothetical protein